MYEKGIIHIGANTGQECERYFPRNVLWIEPIPSVFKKLKKRISKYKNQIAINCLVTDQDNKEYDFYISNNKNHASSSILKLKLHKKMYPSVRYIDTIKITSKTLPTIIKNNNIDIFDYDTIILDTQGSELMILKASLPILKKIKKVIVEVPDFESYENCCMVNDVDDFFTKINYKKTRVSIFRKNGNLSYYDISYLNNLYR